MATTHYQKVDENNEVIIAEAVCDRTKVCMQACCIYVIAALGCLIFLPCALVLGVFLGRKAAVEWRLYLTSTGLHYTKVRACSVKIRINRNKIANYLSWWQRTVVLMDYLKIANVANASDFAAAIKREIARSQEN